MPFPPSKKPVSSTSPRLLRQLILGGCLLGALSGCQSMHSERDADGGQGTDRAVGLEVDSDILLVKAPPENIWERIRDGFELQDQIGNNPRVERQRLSFASRPRNIEGSTQSSSPYIYYIVQQLDEKNMPLELALLPVIESSYNPMAYSRSHAAGLWQFIPSTGRDFNLQQTSWYDGRRDIHASTNAAIRYLDKLHNMFNDDWLLALAAYNCGEGTVSRAIERNQKLGLPTDYWNLQLPKETQEYVPKLLAVSQIVRSPEAYGVSLPKVANQPYFEAVAFTQRMQLSSVAQITDIDEEELLLLNPAYKKGVTLDGPQHLLVPVAKADQFEASLALYKPSSQVDWQQYKVRPGDSLHSIANRYSLTIKTLREINRLPSNQLRLGQILDIPADPRTAPATPIYQAKVARPAKPALYKVKRGDNLSLIAKAQKVSITDLKRWNNLRGNQVKIGQTLKLQGNLSTASASSKGKGTAARKATYYKVRKGDSLYQIAQRFRVDLQQVKQWNPQAANNLQIGQTLALYL